MAEPQNFRFVEELGFKTGLKIDPRLGLQEEITQAIDRLYSKLESHTDLPSSADDSLGIEFISSCSQERNVQAIREMHTELQQKTKTTPAIHLVASIIRAAAIRQASDIHIEPQHEETHVRFRVDGVLRDYQRIPRALQNMGEREVERGTAIRKRGKRPARSNGKGKRARHPRAVSKSRRCSS
jgi:type II secretory ATPase GspE/PulE/Tfp pilus assembly ATPase PilB-like protein